MEYKGNNSLGNDEGEHQSGNPGTIGGEPASEPISGTSFGTDGKRRDYHRPGTGRTRKPRSKKAETETKPGTRKAEPETQDILNKAGFLSENEVETILQDFPKADDTAIPQGTQLDITSATIVLTLLDGVVQMVLGPQYGMTKDERKMLMEPLDRIMAKLPANKLVQYSQYVDPLILLMGLIAWGSRISRMKQSEKKSIPEKQANPEPVQTSQPLPARNDVSDDERLVVPPGLFALENV